MNPNQGLAAGKRVDVFAAAAGRTRLLEDFEQQLERAPHCLYEIRRIIRPAGGDPTRKGNASRHSRILTRGSCAQMRLELHRSARRHGVDIDVSDGIPRAWLLRRRATFPAVEHFLVAAPAGAIEKGDPHFERWWRQAVSAATAAHPQAA